MNLIRETRSTQLFLGKKKRRKQERKRKGVLEGGNGIAEEVDPGNFGRGSLSRIIGWESVGDRTCPVVGFDWRRQQWKCHHL